MFAIFSTAPGQHLERYSVFKRSEGKIQYVPIDSPLYLESHEVDIKPVSIVVQTVTGSVSTHYWYTGWDVVYKDEVIQVHEYLNSHLIFPDVPKVKCEYDYPDWCKYRVQEQKSIYSSMIQMYGYTEHYRIESTSAPLRSPSPPAPSAPLRSPSPPAPSAPLRSQSPPPRVSPAKTIKNEEKLPNFVAEALIKALKDAGAECSISMTPFKSCPKISVTNCYHCFEAESLDKWCKNKMVCPMCKSVVKFISTV
jgi:hypothetical protein